MNELIPNWIMNLFPKGVESNFTQTTFGKIHYLSGGNGQPVLLLHGNPTWGFIWRKVINELDETKYKVYAPDLLNLGFSDGLSKKNFSIENQAMALKEFVQKHDLNNVILVVQDWGGPIGLYMATLLEERISKLVVLNTGLSAPKPPFKVSKFHSFVNKKILPDIMFRFLRYPMYHLGKVQFDKSSISGKVAKAYRYPIKKKWRWGSALEFARMVPNGVDHPSYTSFKEIEAFCSRFSKPVRIVWGVKDPILGKGLANLKNMFPRAVVIQVAAGHFLQEDSYFEIANAVSS